MKVDFGFIAEAADAQSGLFYVVRGGTDIWHVPPGAQYPVGIGPMSFVVRISGDPQDVGREHKLRSTIVDADGHPIGMDNEGVIQVPPHPVDRTRTGFALVHFRLAFQIPGPGAYFFELHADERLCQIPFWVVEGPPPQVGDSPA